MKIIKFLFLIFPACLFAKTDIIFNLPDYFPDLISQTDIAETFQERIDVNGDHLAEANMLGNLSSYAVATPSIGMLPHFAAGAGMTFGFSNMKYYDNKAVEGSFPAVGAAPFFLFAAGLSDRMDVLAKINYFDISAYNPDSISRVSKYVKLEKLRIVGGGGRLRYRLTDKKVIIPLFLSLEGITVSCGGDVLRGRMKLTKDIDGNLGSFSIDPDGSGPAAASALPLFYKGSLSGSLEWYQLDASVSAAAYFNIAGALNLYTGFGAALGYGSFTISAESDVALSTNAIPIINPTGILGSAMMDSDSKYHPYPFIPTYTIGAEFSVFLIKFSAETLVNLKNKEDVTLSFAVRVQL